MLKTGTRNHTKQDTAGQGDRDIDVIASVLEKLNAEGVTLEKDYDRYTRLVRKSLGCAMAKFAVRHPSPNLQYIKSQSGYPLADPEKNELPIEYSFGRHVIQGGRPLILESTPKSLLVKDNPSIHEFGIRAYLGMPVKGPDNRVIGALSALDTVERVWSSADIHAMRDLASCITVSVKLRLLRDPSLKLKDL